MSEGKEKEETLLKLRKRTTIEILGKVAKLVNNIKTPTKEGLTQKLSALMLLNQVSSELASAPQNSKDLRAKITDQWIQNKIDEHKRGCGEYHWSNIDEASKLRGVANTVADGLLDLIDAGTVVTEGDSEK